VAQLTPDEFRELTAELVTRHGLRAVQERLAKTNVVVSRRGISSEAAIARTLYGLTAGLAREGVATHVVVSLWEEGLGAALDEQGGRALEDLASQINACLTPKFEEDPERAPELEAAIESYRGKLAERVGDGAARLTMLMRAVPAVARRVRRGGTAAPADDPKL
jgi:hypothetical protein